MMMITLPPQVMALRDRGALFLVNHSAGKDSQAMAIMLAQHIPAAQIRVVHAELPGVDWDGLRAHIESTVPSTWAPAHYCRADKTLLGMVEARYTNRPDAPSWPSPKYRQCTSDLKRDPITKYLRTEAKNFGGLVVNCMGIRAEESSARAKQTPFKFDKRTSKAGREVYTWLPIFDMLERDVFAAIADAGQQPHPAYAAGMSRLSCCFCIMASTSDLRCAAQLRPDLYRQYVELERKTGYAMHPSMKRLEEITGITIETT